LVQFWACRKATKIICRIVSSAVLPDSSLRGGEADEAIQNPQRRLWIALLRSQ
jgi:hypothetical protein